LSNFSLASPQYLYSGTGKLTTPQLGDVRISYTDLPTGTNVTVFGQLNDGILAAYTDPNNHTLYDLLAGDRQTAIATLHNQYEKTTWILRGVGIGLIWLGLMMLLAPLDTLLDFIPFVGEIGGMLTLVITFPIALVLGGTVIIIGYTLHHVIALLIGVPMILAVWVGIFKLIKRGRGISKRGGGNPPPNVPQPPVNPYSPAPPTSGSLFPTNHATIADQGVSAVPPQPASFVQQPIQHNPGAVVQPTSSPLPINLYSPGPSNDSVGSLSPSNNPPAYTAPQNVVTPQTQEITTQSENNILQPPQPPTV
jgi:hypothetical protein